VLCEDTLIVRKVRDQRCQTYSAKMNHVDG
jgi:hypothetical protein